MTPREKREALWAAGWHDRCRWAGTNEPRRPERWYHPSDRDVLYTLGAAFKLAVSAA